MPPRRVALVLVSLTLAACASSPAQRAFDQGEFGSAAKLADDDVRAQPGDEGAVALRARAREREVELRCASIDAIFRGERGGDALAMLNVLLAEVDDWGGPERLSTPQRARLAVTTANGTKFVAGLAGAASQPLAAEAAVERGAPGVLHGELSVARDDARARVKLAGQKNCSRLRGLMPPEAAGWNLIVDRYCAHFGQGEAPPFDDAEPPTSCASAHTVEEAARCASVGAATPAALAMLATALGEKAELLPDVLGPPPALRAPRAPDAKR